MLPTIGLLLVWKDAQDTDLRRPCPDSENLQAMPPAKHPVHAENSVLQGLDMPQR